MYNFFQNYFQKLTEFKFSIVKIKNKEKQNIYHMTFCNLRGFYYFSN